MKRMVEEPDEKLRRVQDETAEILAGAVARITERVLEPRLAPFTAQADASAKRIAGAATSLSEMKGRLDRKLSELDQRIDALENPAGVQQLCAAVAEVHATATGATAKLDLIAAEARRARRASVVACVIAGGSLIVTAMAITVAFLR